MTCTHCHRPVRGHRHTTTTDPGTISPGANGLCATCLRRQKSGRPLAGWMPGEGTRGHDQPHPTHADLEQRLTDYAQLRRQGLNRHECARRLDVSYDTLTAFLSRHRDDPRSDYGLNPHIDVVARVPRRRLPRPPKRTRTAGGTAHRVRTTRPRRGSSGPRHARAEGRMTQRYPQGPSLPHETIEGQLKRPRASAEPLLRASPSIPREDSTNGSS